MLSHISLPSEQLSNPQKFHFNMSQNFSFDFLMSSVQKGRSHAVVSPSERHLQKMAKERLKDNEYLENKVQEIQCKLQAEQQTSKRAMSRKQALEREVTK